MVIGDLFYLIGSVITGLEKKNLVVVNKCLNFEVQRIILTSELFIPTWTKVFIFLGILLGKDSSCEMTKTSIKVNVSLNSPTIASVCFLIELLFLFF